VSGLNWLEGCGRGKVNEGPYLSPTGVYPLGQEVGARGRCLGCGGVGSRWDHRDCLLGRQGLAVPPGVPVLAPGPALFIAREKVGHGGETLGGGPGTVGQTYGGMGKDTHITTLGQESLVVVANSKGAGVARLARSLVPVLNVTHVASGVTRETSMPGRPAGPMGRRRLVIESVSVAVFFTVILGQGAEASGSRGPAVGSVGGRAGGAGSGLLLQFCRSEALSMGV
jgi:hypothetical protein